ncbi:ATP-binding protein [Streptomyces sp. NPDC003011]
MDQAAQKEEQLQDEGLIKVSEAYEGSSGDIAQARELARTFLERVRAGHGLPVSGRVRDTVQLVVSELLTNTCKYAPGPCLLEVEVTGGRIEITVWDSDPTLPVAKAADPGRVGQHGLEIVLAVCQSFEVHREPVGKRVTAAVMFADDLGGDLAEYDP